MLYVDSARCTGCGLCVDACPNGAIQLVNQVASINAELCQECQACVEACPQKAIGPAEERPTVVEGEVIRVRESLPVVQQPVSVPIRPARRPWSYNLSVALAFLGREVVPQAASYLLEAWERRRAVPAFRERSTDFLSLLSGWRGGGHRQRQRQRRGR
nr:4Fe-4S binding protein [Chloroflexota bacterium]